MPANALNEKHALKNGRPTIAVLAGLMSSTYQEGIVRGVAHVAKEKNYNLITFCGGAINTRDSLSLAREKVFDLVDMNLIDGIISPFSSQMRFLNEQDSQRFIDRFSSVPVINIGNHIDGFTNVVSNFETGFVELFEHLYSVHGYRHILLMRGPKNHGSSENRMAIYKQLLEKYQLPFDDDMVIYANLNRYSAKENMQAFFENSDSPYDAVITLNDNQALGVIDACKIQGIKVPQELAVSGSMNTLEGSFSTPPITSIEEPVFALGCAAANELIAQMEGKELIPEISIPTSLIIKQSCGCASSIIDPAHQASDNKSGLLSTSPTEQPFEETEHYIKQLVEHYKGGIIRDQAMSILALYAQVINGNDCELFLQRLKEKLQQALKSEDISIWLDITARLQLCSLRLLEFDSGAKTVMRLLAQLITLKNEIEATAIKFQRFEKVHYMNSLRMILTTINSSFDLTVIKNNTVDVLQLSEFYISIFQDLDTQTLDVTNILAIRDNESIALEDNKFKANKLIPDEVMAYQDRFSILVFPLTVNKEFIGFMTLNLSERSGHAFENLRAIICSALKNERLIKDLQKAEKRFSDIAHSTSNWLWETDAQHQFTYCSDSSQDIIGYSPESLIGKKIDHLTIEKGDSYLCNMRQYEDLIEFQCWHRHQDGSAICLLISAKAIFTEGVFNGYRGIFDDITESKLQQERIKKLAYFDILTGLPNRTLFQEKLAKTLSFSAENSQKFALMFIDLDRFKEINDSMGHAAGDIFLIKLAERLTQSVRTQDTLARLGGDEFVIIVPDVNHGAEITAIVERIFNNIKTPVSIQDKSIYCSLSLGISVYPMDGVDEQSLLQKGDNAMYQAKSQGRNGYLFYDQLLAEKAL